ncbi:spore coat protein [Psychrobacillus sp. FSL K6-2365]|jgi:spore coat protein X|uniref:spore coat protein n=1 Tax=Psychrobacillus TaxID=1221880 RepID=UPI0008EFE860|nr:spore coat protein [Psychrobacillus psychrodurans]MCZ8540393.1 spore coat protein [Psychrobacillus psychrodurans]SFM59100.1 spore coat protein X [Psychrobacillus psychrodurans]
MSSYNCGNPDCRKCKQRNNQESAEDMRYRNEENVQDTSENNDAVTRESLDATVGQGADQISILDQESDELIWIKDSCNVVVQTTDTQAAVSLQVGLQLAIALVISITIGDSDRGQTITQELFQQFNSEQTNRQRIYIDNSKDVNITTTDIDLAVNIEAMLQILLALVVKLDVL